MRNAYPGYRVPKLGGQHDQYVNDALKAYKQRTRSHPTMQAYAADMNEQDMAFMAALFSRRAQRGQQ